MSARLPCRACCCPARSEPADASFRLRRRVGASVRGFIDLTASGGYDHGAGVIFQKQDIASFTRDHNRQSSRAACRRARSVVVARFQRTMCFANDQCRRYSAVVLGVGLRFSLSDTQSGK